MRSLAMCREPPPGYVGGVAEMDIAERDGRIARDSHGK